MFPQPEVVDERSVRVERLGTYAGWAGEQLVVTQLREEAAYRGSECGLPQVTPLFGSARPPVTKRQPAEARMADHAGHVLQVDVPAPIAVRDRARTAFGPAHTAPSIRRVR